MQNLKSKEILINLFVPIRIGINKFSFLLRKNVNKFVTNVMSKALTNVIKVLKIIIPIILVFLLLINILHDWQSILSYSKNFKPIPLIVSFLVLLSVYPEGGLCWYIVLNKMGSKTNLKETIKVWILSTTSRYIPGTIWQYLGRIELAKKMISIPRQVTITSLLFEIFLGVTAGVIVTALALPYILSTGTNFKFWLFIIPLPLLLFHPIFSGKILLLLSRILNKQLTGEVNKLGMIETFSIFPYFILNFFLNGLALYFLVSSLSGNQNSLNFFQLSGLYSLSWIAGYFAIFAPAGLGVTEATLAYLLSTTMPFSLASLIALSYRILLTIAELTTFLIALKLGDNKLTSKA